MSIVQKFVFGVCLCLIGLTVGLSTLNTIQQKSGQGMKQAQVSETILGSNGTTLPENIESRKPKFKEDVIRLKKGNYSAIKHFPEVKAISYKGNEITDPNSYSFEGSVDGSKEGVYTLKYTVYDDEGNWKREKISVIVEG